MTAEGTSIHYSVVLVHITHVTSVLQRVTVCCGVLQCVAARFWVAYPTSTLELC